MLGILVRGVLCLLSQEPQKHNSGIGKGSMVTFALTIHSAGILVMRLVRVRVIESLECVDKVQGV